jgi:beta-glucosidase
LRFGFPLSFDPHRQRSHPETCMTTRFPLLAGACVLALSACSALSPSQPAAAGIPSAKAAAPLTDWPHIDSAIRPDPAIEARARQILAGMTLAQKIGQMTQPEIKTVTPDQVRQYYIGSVLNGGGSWPGMNKHAAVADWVALADRYHDASMHTDATVPIPVIWGTDAVHGHSNVYGATIFPHNIALGAAHDPALVERIGAATAQSTRATGVDWAFAPTLAVAQDARWGRTYESYSSDGALVRSYAAAYVKGMQGDLRGDGNVIATAKHFIGDGSTDNGKDQGVSTVTRAEMLNTHAQGYYGALGAGVQTVMASYNSWNDVAGGVDHGKMHGAKELLTDALKGKMGFDGFIVSDWNAIGQVPGCSNASCAKSINAGIDMVMVPDDWKAFIANTMQQVQSGEIPMSRIDDAVTRILRVKLRAGLFEHKPSDSQYAGKASALVHRDLARQAVRESLVLLKNNDHALPLHAGQRVLVVGRNADSVPAQTGGWSLTWQGVENSNADFPNADTILAGVREAAGADQVTYSADGKGVDGSMFDVVLAVIGESPYAETAGDIVSSETMRHSARHPEDLAVLRAAAATGKPVVTVLLSGRPLYVNDLMNLSQAFVAAWLPGTEGKGVSDVLFARDGTDFRGTLTFPWPAVPCPAPSNHPDAARAPLFALGYGLHLAQAVTVPSLPVSAVASCGAPATLAIFDKRDAPMFTLQVGAQGQAQAIGTASALAWPTAHPVLRVRNAQLVAPGDAREVTWLAPGSVFSRNPSRNNLVALQRAQGALVFDVKLVHAATAPVRLSMGCGAGCGGDVDIGPALSRLAPGQEQTLAVPLDCFAQHGADLGGIETPFQVTADAPFAAVFGNIRIVAGAAAGAGAFSCPATAG